MTMVGGLDIHRGQFTFEVGDDKTGELRRGRLRQPGRERFRRWLEQFAGEEVHLAVEGCTGWRSVVEEIQAGRVRGASGRSGGDEHSPRPQEPGQE